MTDASITCWMIQSLTDKDDETGAPLYWHHDLGWADQAIADLFTDEARQHTRLPIGGTWVVVQAPAGL